MTYKKVVFSETQLFLPQVVTTKPCVYIVATWFRHDIIILGKTRVFCIYVNAICWFNVCQGKLLPWDVNCYDATLHKWYPLSKTIFRLTWTGSTDKYLWFKRIILYPITFAFEYTYFLVWCNLFM